MDGAVRETIDREYDGRNSVVVGSKDRIRDSDGRREMKDKRDGDVARKPTNGTNVGGKYGPRSGN